MDLTMTFVYTFCLSWKFEMVIFHIKRKITLYWPQVEHFFAWDSSLATNMTQSYSD